MSDNLHIDVYGSDGINARAGGSSLTRTITVHNRGNETANVELWVQPTDERSAPLQQWAQFRESAESSVELKGIEPKNSQQTSLEFRVPPQARDGFYSYEIQAYSNQYLGEKIRRTQQLQVVASTQELGLESEPRVYLEPDTSSSNPAQLTAGGTLDIQVFVENLSDRTDRFSLLCPDLPNTWLDVEYPERQNNLTGVVRKAKGLELNPKDNGVINVKVKPPQHEYAGDYFPALHIYSDNSKKLVSLEVIYFTILPNDDVDIELSPDVRKVPSQEEEFELLIKNLGNIDRHIRLSIQDIDKAFKYQIVDKRYKVTGELWQLFPGEEKLVNIIPSSRHLRHKIWRLQEQNIEFEVTAEEVFKAPTNLVPGTSEQGNVNGAPRPSSSPLADPLRGTIIWRSRRKYLPKILLALLLVGSFALLVSLVWYFLFWRPIFNIRPKILSFESSEENYRESQDQNIRLDWEVENPSQISKIIIYPDNKLPEPASCAPTGLQQIQEESESWLVNCYEFDLANGVFPSDSCSILPLPEEKRGLLQPLYRLHSRVFKRDLPRKEILQCINVDVLNFTEDGEIAELLQEGKYSFSLRVLKSASGEEQDDEADVNSLESQQLPLNLEVVNDLTVATDLIKDIEVLPPEPPEILEFAALASEYRTSEQVVSQSQRAEPSVQQNAGSGDTDATAAEASDAPKAVGLNASRAKIDGTQVQRSPNTNAVNAEGEAIAPILLNWTITNAKDIEEIRLVSAAPNGAENVRPKIFREFRTLSNNTLLIDPQLQPYCIVNDFQLVCESFPTQAVEVGDYTFSLIVTSNRDNTEDNIVSKTPLIQIKPPPPEILNFQVNGEDVASKPKFVYSVNPSRVSFDLKLDWEVNNADEVELLPAPGPIAVDSVLYTISASPGSEVLTLKAINELGEEVEQSVIIEKVEFSAAPTSDPGNPASPTPSALPILPPPPPTSSAFPLYEVPPRTD